jgi:ADP-ribose pyrophosphatase
MPLAPLAGRHFFCRMSSTPSGHGLPRWQKLGQSTQVKTRVFDVLSARYRHPVRGVERDFVVVSPPDWVNVVALTPERRIVLVRQFRYGIDEFSLETPGGVIEAGEDPIAAGVRELREETGFSGAPAKLLGCVHPNPAIQSNRCHFVFIDAAVKSHDLEWDNDEEMHVTTEPVEDVLAAARNGGITHGLVLNALALFEHQWRNRI